VGGGGKIRGIRFRGVQRPLRTTFSTALGQKRRLQSILVRVVLDDGVSGVGEIPTSAAFADETPSVIARVLREAGPRLLGAPVDDYGRLIDGLRRDFPQTVMTISGLDVALFRAFLARRQIPEHRYWGGHLGRLETDITLPFVTDREVLAAWIGFAARKGFTTYKLKVSGNLDQDRAVLSSVHELLHLRVGRFHLRLDGNQGYTQKTFLAFLDYIQKERYGIELFEQPLRKDDFHGLASIKERSPLPIILDETILSAADARRAIDNNLGDGINIKIAKSGIGESTRLLELARSHRMKVMIGCMIETMVGLSAAVQLAAGAGSFDFIDLDAVYFLYGKNAYPGIEREGPAFLVDSADQ
jgi:L-alanine-DL-glutamate epimerase-like enolase superfamily enzyme